jgi:hypothetical protein
MQRERKTTSSYRPVVEDGLDDRELHELKIIKQAILKSSIEGGIIEKRNPINSVLDREETDEEFIERWLKYIYRNTEADKKLTETEKPVLKDNQGNDIPF